MTFALMPLLLAACLQDGAATANREEQNGIYRGKSVTEPPPLGSPDNGREEIQRLPELFDGCDSEAVREWTGRQFSATTETALLRVSGAATLRPVRPGDVVSMDFQSDRLTIELDRADVIVALRCG